MNDAQSLIARLGLSPHPEGGWYRETWRAPAEEGGRSPGTAIHFLLEEGQKSHWHRVDATEIWLWHSGSPLWLSLAPGDEGPVSRQLLGPGRSDAEAPQMIVPAHHWQAAHANDGWALVSCIVVPGFTFSGFELAPPSWAPGLGKGR